jgi:hypothetical protein
MNARMASCRSRGGQRTGAYARARARRDSAGAAMFIVAMTLGLLAAMGVYGLSATAVDIRAAGHLRESAQAQSAAEHAMVLTADTFTPATSGELVRAMQSGSGGSGDIQSTKCKTANRFNTPAEPNEKHRAAQSCLAWNLTEMENLSKNVNAWINMTGTSGTDRSTFTAESFGEVPNKAFLRVEVTNPVDVPPPPGTSLSDRFTFTQITATVFVDMKTASGVPADSMVLGRGRMTVGPYFRQ